MFLAHTPMVSTIVCMCESGRSHKSIFGRQLNHHQVLLRRWGTVFNVIAWSCAGGIAIFFAKEDVVQTGTAWYLSFGYTTFSILFIVTVLLDQVMYSYRYYDLFVKKQALWFQIVVVILVWIILLFITKLTPQTTHG